MDPERAIRAVFSIIQRHIAEAETAKVRHALPENIRMLWPPNAGIHRVKHGDGSTKVADVMSRNVQLASPNDTLEEIAKRMAMEDLGFLPVGENDRLVGMITDRDIVARAVALGRDGQSRVRDAMTENVKYCFEDDSIEDAIQSMTEAYLAAGYPEAESKLAAMSGALLPHLSELKQAGVSLVELANSYRQAGDAASAQAALQMGLDLGQRLDDPNSMTLIQTLVGIAVQRKTLDAMAATASDLALPCGAGGQPCCAANSCLNGGCCVSGTCTRRCTVAGKVSSSSRTDAFMDVSVRSEWI